MGGERGRKETEGGGGRGRKGKEAEVVINSAKRREREACANGLLSRDIQ